MSEELEKAGKERDMDVIHEKTSHMLETYSKLLSDLSVYYLEETDEDKPLINDEILREQLVTLCDACENLDMDAMEAVGTELRKYSYPDGIKDTLDRLLRAIDDVDIDECERLLGEIKED